ncbi:MAG: hypothetical protein EOR33_28100 [Mesorhizobium sp.]|nr:MAG: hypothetical protein EOR33_28100 [Mesorhizobium sp.]
MDVMSQIIRHVCSSSLEKIPKQAIERAKLSILDTVACAIGGSNDPIAHLARVLAAQLRRRDSRLMLLQHADDLVFREPALLHLRLLSTESSSNRGHARGQRHWF